MLKGLRPPKHRIDQPGYLILQTDDALDSARYLAELEQIEAAADAERLRAVEAYRAEHAIDGALTDEQRADAQKAADFGGLRLDDHPLNVYWRGESRYDLKAEGLLLGKPVKIREYFSAAEPTIFTLRRLSFQEWNRICEIEQPVRRLHAFALAGVAAIHGPGVSVDVKEHEQLPDAWMQALFDTDHSIGLDLGSAVAAFNRPLTESEKKGAPPAGVAV